MFLTDIDECSENLYNCTDLEYCRDTVGGYECDCIKGYWKNESTCEGGYFCIIINSKLYWVPHLRYNNILYCDYRY